MAFIKRRRRSSRSRTPSPSAPGSAPRERPEYGALVVFGLLVTLAPLAFGATDRIVQIGLLALFAVGLALRPPEVLTLSRRAGLLALGAVALLAGREFAPAGLFGGTLWRTEMGGFPGVALPWTHHPEPGRAVDALLALGLGLLWCLWVRTLAGWRSNRPVLAWALLGSAALVAAVSFATRNLDPEAIYGLRFTRGYYGFGPFPNRNHTADFLAVGFLAGLGAIAWAGRREYRGWLLTGLFAAGLTLAALLTTQSRGGLVALLAGGAFFGLLAAIKMRSRQAAIGLGLAVVAVTLLGSTVGAATLARFQTAAGGASVETRQQIWRDAWRMWRDAPLWGHGLGSFEALFPLYQQLSLDNQVVLHPESSWLLGLVELGLLPMLAGAGLLIFFMGRHLRATFSRQSSFFLRAGAAAGVVALAVHAAMDVPAHRWATAGLGLAALGMMAPLSRRAAVPAEREAPGRLAWPGSDRRVALLPLAVAGFWLLPFLAESPRWAPMAEDRLVYRGLFSGAVPTAEMQAGLGWFPLDERMHQLLGLRLLFEQQGQGAGWREHFAVARRLSPGSWPLPLAQAQACRTLAPAEALRLWGEAVERSGGRGPEQFLRAVEDSAAVPGAPAFWAGFVAKHPELSGLYAQTLPPAGAAQYMERWWLARGQRPVKELGEAEVLALYVLLPRVGTVEQLHTWMQHAAPRAEKDHARWAGLLHDWQQDREAWEMLQRHRPEAALPEVNLAVSRELMERRWAQAPGNLTQAQALVTWHCRRNDPKRALEILKEVMARPNAAPWFYRKAAYLEAAKGDYRGAVECLLKEPFTAGA